MKPSCFACSLATALTAANCTMVSMGIEAAVLDRLAAVWLTTGVVPVAHIVADADDAESWMPAPETGAATPSATMAPVTQEERRPAKELARWLAVSHGFADRAHHAWR